MGLSEKDSRKVLDFYLPGMITIDGKTGLFPAISITGGSCALGCVHCKGYLLQGMIHCETPEKLIDTLKMLEKDGMLGALITGGCLLDGTIPLMPFLERLSTFKTNLYLTCHAGLNVDRELATAIKKAGIRQALIDVIGDEETFREIYHLNDHSIIKKSLDNLYMYGPDIVPHVVIGVNRGKIKGEFEALNLIHYFSNKRVVLVVLMPDILTAEPPPIDEVIEVFRYARQRFQEVSLGCARPRGRYRRELEIRLIEEGLIDRMALWSDDALSHAEKSGYSLNFKYTCCSVDIHGTERD